MTLCAPYLIPMLWYRRFCFPAVVSHGCVKPGREELLGDYIPYTELAEIPEATGTPRCRDPHDQIFSGIIRK